MITESDVTVMCRSCAFFYQLVGRALRPLTIIDDSIHREAIAGDISKFPGKVVPKSNDDLQEDQVCYVVVPDGQNIEKLWGRLGIDADFQVCPGM